MTSEFHWTQEFGDRVKMDQRLCRLCEKAMRVELGARWGDARISWISTIHVGPRAVRSAFTSLSYQLGVEEASGLRYWYLDFRLEAGRIVCRTKSVAATKPPSAAELPTWVCLKDKRPPITPDKF